MRSSKRPWRPCWLLITLAAAACASSGADTDGEGRSVRRDANLITAEELAEVSDRSVYEAIQVLRPAWLRRTGFRNDLPSVVRDSQHFELEILESMPPDAVESLRFVGPSDATVRWGTGYPSGVIEVLTRRR